MVLFIVLNVEISFNDKEQSKVNYWFYVSFCGVHPLERWYLKKVQGIATWRRELNKRTKSELEFCGFKYSLIADTFLEGKIGKLRASNFLFFRPRPPHPINCIACFFKLNGSIWKQTPRKSKPTYAFPKCRISFRLRYFFTDQLAGKLGPNVLNSYASTLDFTTLEQDKSVILSKMCEPSMFPNKRF